MSAISRAKHVYEQHGAIRLLTRGIRFVCWRAITRVISEATVKRLILKSSLLSALYFYIRRTFHREQRSILSGQIQYLNKEVEPIRNRIVRNTHRLEKGLSMRERRSLFGEGYIEQLISDLDIYCEANGVESSIEDRQIQWTLDVLDEYFDVVDHTDPISRANERYQSILLEINYSPGEKRPFKRRAVNPANISYEEIRTLAEQRTSTRWFRDESVPRDLIDDAVRVAAQSPSACNRQSIEFRIFDDKDLINRIGELPVGAGGFIDNVPCLVVLVGKRRAYPKDRDRHVIYIDGSLAAMSFQFGLETLGLASCCINWPVIPERESEMQDLLGLDDDEVVIMLLAVGYPDPDGYIPYSEKRPLRDLRQYNEYRY